MNNQPNQVRGATVFCIPGGHPVDIVTEWTLVRASVDDDEWYEDRESPCSIPVCSNHSIRKALP